MERYQFSNFRRLSQPLHYGELRFWYIENFYQAMKTDDGYVRLEISKMSPKEAKAAGQRPWQPKFDRIPVMRWAIQHAFTPGSQEANELLATGNSELTEWNRWHDIGKLHMEQRSRLREQRA